MVGNTQVVAALTKLKSYLDYGAFQPIQIAATVTLNEATDYPTEVCNIYQARRDALCDGPNRIGWNILPPKGTMFAWAPIPEPYLEMGSVEFASQLVREANVAVSPGVGFGPGGEGYVRFALIENEQRIGQAVRNLRGGFGPPGLVTSTDRKPEPVPGTPIWHTSLALTEGRFPSRQVGGTVRHDSPLSPAVLDQPVLPIDWLAAKGPGPTDSLVVVFTTVVRCGKGKSAG